LYFQIVNMQETSRQIVNHIRIMIEEAEHINEKSNVSPVWEKDLVSV